jgi:hypothetical protein
VKKRKWETNEARKMRAKEKLMEKSKALTQMDRNFE